MQGHTHWHHLLLEHFISGLRGWRKTTDTRYIHNLSFPRRYGSLDLGSRVAADVARQEGQPAEASSSRSRSSGAGGPPRGPLSGKRRTEGSGMGDDAGQWAELESVLASQQPGMLLA